MSTKKRDPEETPIEELPPFPRMTAQLALYGARLDNQHGALRVVVSIPPGIPVEESIMIEETNRLSDQQRGLRYAIYMGVSDDRELTAVVSDTYFAVTLVESYCSYAFEGYGHLLNQEAAR